MAPSTSRRPTQNSTTPSPIPLPGVALGVVAAIAAGFAASLALRRRKPAQRLQDEQQSISANKTFEEREIEIKEEGSNLINANGTITLAQEPSKLAAGSLKPVFDAIEEVSLVQEGDEIRPEEKVEAKKWEEEGGERQIEETENGGDFEDNEEKGEIMEIGKANEEESESAEVIVEIEASVAVDDASVKELQRSILEKAEGKDETEAGRKRTEVEGIGVIVNGGDVCDNDERSSAHQQPSPVLINGKTLDSYEEILDNKDESDVISSGSNSLSDGLSESSTQEVSSAPVRPFVPTEETLEASWPGAKPADLNQSSQETTLPEDKKWSCGEASFPSSGDGLPETTREVPEFAENLSHAGEDSTCFKHDRAISNNDVLQLKAPERDVDTVLLNLKPVSVEIEEKEASCDKENQIKFDSQSDVMDTKGDPAALEGKVSTEGNGLDEGLAESTTLHAGEPSNGSSFLKELDECESVGESEHVVQSTREAADDFTGLQYKGEDIVEPAHSNGEVPCEDFAENLEAMPADETSLQTGQEGADTSDFHSNPDLLAGSGLSGNKTPVSSENDVYDGESTQENGESTEECDIVENILEEPKPQPAVLNLDHVDGMTAENNVKLKPDQSNLLISSRGVSEGLEISCEASPDNSNGEDMGDGLAGEVSVKERIPIREQEFEATTSSCEPNDHACEKMGRISLTESAQGRFNRTREADDLLLEGAVHQHGLQSKGVSMSRALAYLPLEIGVICLLMALISYALWYFEMIPDVTVNKLMSISN